MEWGPPLQRGAMRARRCLIGAGWLLGLAIMPPAAAAQAGMADDHWIYHTVPGDNLYTLAMDYLAPGVGWQRLQRLNQVDDPLRLQPGTALRMPVAWLRPEATVAKVVYVSGNARRESAAGVVSAVALNDELQPKDRLSTEPDASVSLRLADSTRVLVGGGAEVQLESLLVLGRSGVTQTRIRVQQGEAESRVNPSRNPSTRYEIQTPSLNLGVRGTDFRVRVNDEADASLAEVTQGRVAAKPAAPAAQPLRIDAGFGVVADAAGGTPKLQPLLPAPAMGALPTVYERLPLAIAWPAIDGAVGYRAQIFADAGLEQRLHDRDTARAAASWADLPDGRYWLQVRGRDPRGLEGRSGGLAFSLQARPEPPFANLPRQNARVTGSGVELVWTQPDTVRRYRLQLSADESFKAPQIDRDDLTVERLPLSLPPGRYHWRLASITGDGKTGPFGDPSSFELRETPPPPALAEAPQARGDQLVFRWPARSGSDAYQVQVASDPAFTRLVLERQVDSPELALDTPPAGSYYLRVRTVEAEGDKGPFSTAQRFEVARGNWWWWVPVMALLLVL